jgi:hypothetical protein
VLPRASADNVERWERRERKKQAEANRMKKSGVSVRMIQQIIAKRAADAKAKRDRSREKADQRRGT